MSNLADPPALIFASRRSLRLRAWAAAASSGIGDGDALSVILKVEECIMLGYDLDWLLCPDPGYVLLSSTTCLHKYLLGQLQSSSKSGIGGGTQFLRAVSLKLPELVGGKCRARDCLFLDTDEGQAVTVRFSIASRHKERSFLTGSVLLGSFHKPPKMATAYRRLLQEYRSLTNSPPDGIAAGPVSEDDMLLWEAVIQGPEGTPFEGGVFPAELRFPKDYPLVPPTMRFVGCEVWHPNGMTTNWHLLFPALG